MENFIIISILLVITVSIVSYLVRAKRRGEKCIGCPSSKQCCGKCGSNNQP